MTQSSWRAGWVDGCIPEWVEHNIASIQPHWHILISIIDSGPEVTCSPMLSGALGFPRESPGRALVFAATDLKRLVFDTPMFFGFDEIWVLRSRPSELPTRAPIRLDCSDTAPDLSAELITWLDTYNVAVGLGDGLGLAFVVDEKPDSGAFTFDF